MNEIPQSPPDREPFRQSRQTPETPRQRRSIFGKAWRGVCWVGTTPVRWLGTRSIREGANLIADLASRVRVRSRRDQRFRTEEQGAFDLRATAFSYGITVPELERRLSARRRNTALIAYALGVLGLVFFGAWLLQIFAAKNTGRRMLLTIEFQPFCVLFALLAFYQALINFQIRAGRTASWREYLTTNSGFWPRP
ncbi:MAG: hypothetical protein ABI369_08345 [Acetobacteraceae bacterium]